MLREVYRWIIALVSGISPKLASKIYYRTKLHKKLDLVQPKLFNEKLMWLKLNEYENNKEEYQPKLEYYSCSYYIHNRYCFDR